MTGFTLLSHACKACDLPYAGGFGHTEGQLPAPPPPSTSVMGGGKHSADVEVASSCASELALEKVRRSFAHDCALIRSLPNHLLVANCAAAGVRSLG